ncbi:MAG: Hsp70 family protein [Planctomycetes bacterium]|nr:Hsp70 family protein [Planctomycetota bacterium]
MTTRWQSNIVGIDLGTTFSVIARLGPDGSAMTIPNQDGEPLTPSVIFVEGSTALVGREAREAAAVDSSKAAMFVKREMGKPFFSRQVAGRQFRPETLSAIILRKLKQDAEKHIGTIKKAVITVPAFFDDTRRKATEDAGRIAGLEVLDIINEPTAAALAHALEGQHSQTGPIRTLDFPGGEMVALVYDLGGGTFDCTVVRLASKRFETLATDGAVQLGGKDWDDKIVEHMAQEFRKRYGINPAQDQQRRDSMTSAAEKAKKFLSKLTKAPLECFHQGQELRIELTRAQFEDMTRDLMAQTQIVTELVVQQAKMTWDRINRVLLVGGSTKMPMVKQMLRQVTGKEPDDSLDADQVVARGAAIHAGIVASKDNDAELEVNEELKEELKDVVEVNVNAYSLGVEAVQRDGRQINAILIPKNTQLPFAASRIFHTRRAGANNVRVKVLEGEAPDAAANIQIGECLVTQLPPNLPAKAPIQVRCSYGANGRISVMALDMTGGRFAHAEIKREYGLSESDVRREAEYVNSLTIQ